MLVENCTILFCNKLCFQHWGSVESGREVLVIAEPLFVSTFIHGDCMAFCSCFGLRLYQLARMDLFQLTILVSGMDF